MIGRTLAAVVIGLGMPMALFLGVLSVGSEPNVVRELDVHRVEAADVGSVRTVPPREFAILPPAVQVAFETAIRQGDATVTIDKATEMAIAHFLGNGRTSAALLQLGGAILHVEIRSYVELSRGEAFAQDARAWAANVVAATRSAVDAIRG